MAARVRQPRDLTLPTPEITKTTADESMRPQLETRLLSHLQLIYPDRDSQEICNKILEGFWPSGKEPRRLRRPPNNSLWSERDCVAITYGDTVTNGDTHALKGLNRFLKDRLGGIVSSVHILPFFPYSSDDGFAVEDYTTVNPELGTWDDIGEIASDFRLMADLVLNHASASSEWFKQYQRGEHPGAGFFVEADPAENLTEVVRPRPSPLLRTTETVNGTRHVWCTFGHDQIDINFENPDALIEFTRILRLHIDKGVRIVRMDAVAFLWKIVGTPCIHLEQTHEIIRLFRTLTDFCEEPVILITETNVPNHENLAYFGNQNEAHAIYNFSLPPLVLHALLSGTSDNLNSWLMSMPPALPGCAYINFTASHDGIGLRPCEGLLPPSEIARMITAVEAFGGTVSMRSDRAGLEQPYELNIALFDALAGTLQGRDEWQVSRFLCSQVIMMSLEGIPAFYIHSLLASGNDIEALNRTQHNRAINRRKWNHDVITHELDNPRSHHHSVFTELTRLISLRIKQPAFHPNATQYTLQLGDPLFGIWRQSLDRSQSIFAVANLTNEEQSLPLYEINLIAGMTWADLISGQDVTDARDTITLAPYQCVWLTNKL